MQEKDISLAADTRINPMETMIENIVWASRGLYPGRYRHRNRSLEVMRKAKEKRERRQQRNLIQADRSFAYVHGPVR